MYAYINHLPVQVTLSLNLKAILNLRMVQVTRHFQGNRMKVHKKVYYILNI